MSAQAYGTVADFFGKPVFAWVQRREDEKIAAWIEGNPSAWIGPQIETNPDETPDYTNYDEYQEPIRVMRARLRAARKVQP